MSGISYQSGDTALVLVDPYNDFLSEGGKVWPRVSDVAESVELHRHLRELLAAVRSAGIRVFIAPHRRWRPGDFEDWQRPSPPHVRFRDARVFEDGTWGGEFHPDCTPEAGDVVCSEHWTENGFAQTDLDVLLRQHGIGNLILAGMTAPGCVEGTARYAAEVGYTVTLVRDATAAYTPELMHAAHELTGPLWASAILTTDELISALDPPAAVGDQGQADGTTVELTRFRVAHDRVEALLAARPAMLRDFRADRVGFIDAQLIRLADDEWLDVVRWRSPADFAASRAKGANLPGIKAFFDTIDELVSSEEGAVS